jgi:hypothetical protein
MMWSLNGQWFSFKLGERTFLWEVNQNKMADAVDPAKPKSPIPLVDFAALGITRDPGPALDLWLPPAQ